MTEDAKNVLLAAADRIEKYGLSHGSWASPDDRGLLLLSSCKACIGGALALTLTDNALESPMYLVGKEHRVLEEVLGILGQHLGLVPNAETGSDMLDAVIDWNDAHTQEEVVAELRAAAS